MAFCLWILLELFHLYFLEKVQNDDVSISAEALVQFENKIQNMTFSKSLKIFERSILKSEKLFNLISQV